MINREANVQKIDLTGADYYRLAFPSALKIFDVYLYYVENDTHTRHINLFIVNENNNVIPKQK